MAQIPGINVHVPFTAPAASVGASVAATSANKPVAQKSDSIQSAKAVESKGFFGSIAGSVKSVYTAICNFIRNWILRYVPGFRNGILAADAAAAAAAAEAKKPKGMNKVWVATRDWTVKTAKNIGSFVKNYVVLPTWNFTLGRVWGRK